MGPVITRRPKETIRAHSATSLSPMKHDIVCRPSTGVTVNVLEHHGPTGGPRVISGPRPVVTRTADLLVTVTAG
jgi:hypothetical protein